MTTDRKKLIPRLRGDAAVVAPRLAAFVLTVVLVSAYLMSQIDDFGLIDVAPHFFIAIALQLIPFVVRPTADPFEPAGITATHNLLALVPALTGFMVNQGVSITLLPHVSGRARIELVQTVLIAYSTGSIAYYLGYYQRLGIRFKALFPKVSGGEWDRSRLIVVSVVCFGLFIPAYAYFQIRVGASITDITKLAAGKAVWRDDATMSWLMRAVGLGFIPCLLFITLNFPKFRWGRGLLTAGLLFVVGFLSTRLGQRGTAIFFVINALIVIHYLGRRIPMSVLALVAFLLLVVSNVLGAYRSNPDQFTASGGGPTANLSATETLVEHDDDRARLAAMAVVFHFFPDRKDYLMGESWGPILTAPIPRWLWPEKVNLFVWRDTNMIPELIGARIPVPYLGLLYSNFSWVGVVLGMALWGLVQRGMYEWLLENRSDRSTVVLYSFVVVYFTPTMLQLSGTIGFVLPLWVALRFMRKKVAAKKKGVAALPGMQGGGRPVALLPAAGEAAAE